MKLAAAALSLFLIVPGMVQAQALVPPRLLYPGESPPSPPPPTPTPTPTPGTYPSLTTPLGIDHPECLATYGKTAAQIAATPCGAVESPGANTTISACTHNGVFLFQGDNTTIDCVNWTTGATGFGMRCSNADGCKNMTIRRSTIVGNNNQGSAQNLLLIGTNTGAMKSILVEKNDVSRSDVLMLIDSGPDGNVLPYPGEGDKAVIVRNNRMHAVTHVPGAHTDVITIFGGRGVLIEKNLLYGLDSPQGSNEIGSMIQNQGVSATSGNHVIRNNHVVSDTDGHTFNFDGNPYCAAPVKFDNNKVDLNGNSSVFSYTKLTVTCPRVEERGGISSCAGNTFEDGSPLACSSDGR